MISFDLIISLSKRRGFIFPGSEVYGGLAGTWDYGPLGVLMKENIKREWWRAMLEPHIYPLDSAILESAKVLEASGHVRNFSDPLVECQKCKKRFRDDHISHTPGDIVNPNTRRCPECDGNLGEVRRFNLMFKTHAGAVEDESTVVYLRPETAQGIFINFKNVVDAFHPKLAFGIAQIGKAFRNEITSRNFLFRSREFEQMELEYFCDPQNAEQYFGDIRAMRMKWFIDLGIKKENLQFHDYDKDELAHYASATTDIEYRYGLSENEFSELEGIANRTDFDLKNHFKGYSWIEGEFVAKDSGFVPYVIEPSVGVDRAFLAFLIDAYTEDEVGGEKRTFLKLHPKIAPVKVAVFPLVGNKENITAKAKEVFNDLRKHFTTRWDDIGNIGKRYRRQDEIGTPWCVTIDYQTLEDDTVTIRDRDTARQERVVITDLKNLISEKLA
ncbi:MAG: glycine--tRNA ligase [Patescibacteria group bacterium]